MIDVEPIGGPGDVSGTLEVQGSRWLFRKDPVVMDLQPSMTVNKTYWDTLFSVYVTADQDIKVSIRSGGRF